MGAGSREYQVEARAERGPGSLFLNRQFKTEPTFLFATIDEEDCSNPRTILIEGEGGYSCTVWNKKKVPTASSFRLIFSPAFPGKRGSISSTPGIQNHLTQY